MVEKADSPVPKDAKPGDEILAIIRLYTSRIRAIRRCTRQHVEPAFAETSEFIRKLHAEAVVRGQDADGAYTIPP